MALLILGRDSGMDIDRECDFICEVSDDRDNSKPAHEKNTVSSPLEDSYSVEKVILIYFEMF